MLKNKYLKLAAILLMLCLITTCGISGTLAKYTTGGTATDSARVAKWGVVLNVAGDNAFSNAYGETVVSSDLNKNVVAPGTSGALTSVSVSGTPEVAIRYTVEANLELTGWTVSEGGGSLDYCPLVFTIGSTEIFMENGDSLADFEEKLENAVIAALVGDSTGSASSGGGLYKSQDMNAGTSLSKTVSVNWKWDYDPSSAPAGAMNSDERDTKIGMLATSPTVSFTLDVSITQIN